MYLASQIVMFIAFILSLVAYHLKTKKGIFEIKCVENIFNIMHYLFLGAYSGCMTKVIALSRDIFILEKEKYKCLNKRVFFVIFILIYIIMGILTFKNIFSIFPFAAALIYMSAVWNGNALSVKRTGFYCYFLWLAYNISIFSIMGILSNCVSLISSFIAYNNARKINK